MIDLEQLIGSTPDGGTCRIPIPPAPLTIWPNTYLRNIIRAQGITVVPDVPGVAIQGFVSQGSEGITFDGLTLVVDPAQQKAFVAQTGARLHLKNLDLHGTGILDGAGIGLSNCPNSSVENCDIHDLNTGMTFSHCDNLLVTGNKIHDTGGDVMQFNASSHVTITNNHATRIIPSQGDHNDFIQFQGVGQTGPATDITIMGNVWIRGDGVPQPNVKTPGTQGIFMGDESGFGYGSVTIKNNAILGSIYNGIAIGHADASLVIENNLVASYTDTLQIDYSNNGQLIDIVGWIFPDVSCLGGTVRGNQATSLNQPANSLVTWTNNKQIPVVASADAQALLDAWLATISPVDPRDAEILMLNKEIALYQTALNSIRNIVARSA